MHIVRTTIIFIGLFLITFSFHVANAAEELDVPAPLVQKNDDNSQIDCDDLGIKCPESSGLGIINTRILKLVNTLISRTSIIVVIVLLYGAFKYITSTGDEAEAKKAKMIIIYALIGLIVIGVAAIAVNFFINALTPPQVVG